MEAPEVQSVMNLGGGTTTDTPQSSLVKLLSSDMASVTESSEFVKLINEFEESGSGDKMNDHTWVYCVTDAEAQSLREKYQGDELSLAILEVLLFSADVVSRDYAKENDIMLIYPDEDYINRTLEAVGLPADYAMNDNENGDKRLEIFAIAKRTVNGRTFRFTYQAFKADDAVSGDVRVSDDISAISQDYASSDVSGDVVFYYDENGNVIRSADVESKGKESVSTGTDDKTGRLSYQVQQGGAKQQKNDINLL